ncbi:hypothetical protein CER19_27525 [Pseudomonas sp. GL93]|uniref:hypothetical protein n=1 Tax=unclassified Pseudomonas TaxID=196821 RepID=UPI000E31E60A|nr:MULTISPECIES: hypothetical protein [unclassified Pseudomonas]RFD23986.1 hypothetical protein CER19_27525 [Pseudomonas sp. GL93]
MKHTVFLAAACVRLRMLLGAALLPLAGCQSHTPAEAAAIAAATQQQEDGKFTSDFQTVLYRNSLAANALGLQGAVDMQMTVDSQNNVVGCSARSSRYEQRIASGQDDLRIGRLITDICWNALFPEVRPEVFVDSKDTQTIIAPVVLVSLRGLSDKQKEHQKNNIEMYKQIRFFRENLMTKQDIDSVGVATFHFVSTAEGLVRECLVNLDPSAYRPKKFKIDNALQQRLSTQCKHLNFQQMPGFNPNKDGLFQGYVSVEYSPWMNRQKKP